MANRVSDVIEPGLPWQTFDPAPPLVGREIGMDLAGIDGWRMDPRRVVPGFPRHPHRGFETITIAKSGFIDHADSLRATARFGESDVQQTFRWPWGSDGPVHARDDARFDDPCGRSHRRPVASARR